jgi:hypothetical protein
VGAGFTEIEYALKVVENLITWSRVLLQKVIFAQHVKTFPEFDVYGRPIAVFTRSRHWSPF